MKVLLGFVVEDEYRTSGNGSYLLRYIKADRKRCKTEGRKIFHAA